jgi:hypothetical protein
MVCGLIALVIWVWPTPYVYVSIGNSKEVADAHYIKPETVLPDVRKAVNTAMRGLIN